MLSNSFRIYVFIWLILFPNVLLIEAGKPTRMEILESVLKRSTGEAKAKVWILLSYTQSQKKGGVFWKMLESTFEDRDMFDEILKDEYERSKEFIEELIFSSTIKDTTGDIHLFFDKAISRTTRHLSGTKVTLLLPGSYSLAETTKMIKEVRRLSSQAPLVEVSSGLGKWGSALLDSYDIKDLCASILEQSTVAAGTIGAAWAAGAVGMTSCGPLCAAGAAAGAFVVTKYSLESFMDWFRKFIALRPDEALKEAYYFFGLDEDSTNAEIRRAWRRIAAKVHPDHGGNHYAFTEASLKIMLIKRHRMDRKNNSMDKKKSKKEL